MGLWTPAPPLPRRPPGRRYVASVSPPAAVAGLAFAPLEASDLSAPIDFVASGGYVIARHAGAGTAAPATSTDSGWTEVANVYPGSGGRVLVPLPTNSDEYTLAVAGRNAAGAVSAFSTVDVFGLAAPALEAVTSSAALSRVANARQGWPVLELDTRLSWAKAAAYPAGAQWRYDASVDGPDGWVTFDADTPVSVELLNDPGGTPLGAEGWPAGSAGMLVRLTFPVAPLRRYVRPSEVSE